ncbi:hypothetical protein [Morganella morganii]|uniref:hypothetical protein n=1 Tax=Morganella morganii TaxID=582 RepID=UPI003EB8CE95
MTWETIFDGTVMSDHITVERYIDDVHDDNYPVRVKATDKTPPQLTTPIVEPGSIIIPLPPHDPTKFYTFEYDNIDDMYDNFADESGRNKQFMDELEKAILGD